MDKTWILKDRDSLAFEMGVKNFLIYAEENSEDRNKIPCPCGRCANFKKFSIKTIRGHIYDNGFCLGYVHWVWHGETASTGPKSSSASCPPEEQAPDPPPEQAFDEASEQDQEHVAASETVDVCEAAYNSSQYDNDSYQFRRFVADAEQPLYEGSDCTKLESMLKLHNWKSRFGITDSAFTDLLSSVGSLLPKDNVLPSNAYEAKKNPLQFRGVHADATKCPKCRLSRWKLTKKGEERINLPAKVMWYFPIIPRFKRMFKSPSTAKLMCWHAQQRIQDGKMRHPADSPSWKNIDYRWPSFGSEPRNLRLALSADGVNPHNNGLSNRYSCWPVILVTYNLPPWGYKCCPVCGDDTVAKFLTHSRKMCYQGHHRYLPLHHPYRRHKAAFNGQQEFGQPRRTLSGEEVLAEQEQIKFEFGKKMKKAKKVESPWKKKSVFFELEYWKFHHVRHCIDVMHVEKNVCDSLIGTLLNMRHKTKDSAAARRDMMEMGVRSDLAPQVGVKKTYLPPSPFTLSKAEKRTFLSSLMSMKLPYGHASNIKNCVSMPDLNIYGLKSHDCHILLQQLLSVAIRSVLPKHVRVTIIRLCFFFNALCNKVVDVSKLDKLQSDIILTLCDLEKVFHASFFDVMVHIVVHLVQELRLCGPVFYRWMYAFERFNKVLKSYVRNHYYPEGCMAESYLGEESVEFCTEFLSQNYSTAGLPKDQDNKISGPLSAVIIKSVEEKERDEAHLHVLLNNAEVFPYILMHKEYLEEIHRGKRKSLHWLMREHNRLFPDWFQNKVNDELRENNKGVSDTIRWLAAKPSFSVLTYQGYLVNGVQYFTKERDDIRVVQNSGVSVIAKAVQVSSAKDLNPIESDLTFYGIIQEIWELDYHAFKAPLFLCKWASNDKGIRVDDLGFTLVDFSRQGHKKDKYVSVDQVKQVFYLEDPVDATWSIVLSSTTRDYQELYNEDDLGDTIMEHPPFCTEILATDVTTDDVAHTARPNVEGIWIKNTATKTPAPNVVTS
ncbi:uncharacterized protein LOC141706541 [Apium graveolens]|uniref:uncharacterized protein LOC141706541 n=1 Tax=Apium graveolens TaxID=4045 RepID=UPI003D7AD18F